MSNHLRNVQISLLEQLPNDEYIRGCAVSCDVILGSGNSSNQGSSWVLDLLETLKQYKQ